jgi:hypothetical protein
VDRQRSSFDLLGSARLRRRKANVAVYKTLTIDE